MQDKNNDHILDFIIAISCVLFVIPVSTFTVRKKFPYKGLQLRWAIITGVSGLFLFLIKYFIRHMETIPFDFSLKKVLLIISILSINLLATSILLITERWWKGLEYVRGEMTEGGDL